MYFMLPEWSIRKLTCWIQVAQGHTACGNRRSWEDMGKKNGNIMVKYEQTVWLWWSMRMLLLTWKTKVRLMPLPQSRGWNVSESVFQVIIPLMSCLDFSPHLLNTSHFRENALKCFICSVLNNLPNIRFSSLLFTYVIFSSKHLLISEFHKLQNNTGYLRSEWVSHCPECKWFMVNIMMKTFKLGFWL